ncbi:MAG: NAD(P)/FAD-dependent oxidoreductase [Vicingaceae bacterium]
MKKKVVVIGGGAAGFFAAINLAEQIEGKDILMLEKTNQVLTKVKVSGGGRCNVTHACFEPKELSTYYPRGEKELLGPFHRFYTADTIAWFSDRGIELKVEEDGRMFPLSNSSQTIINCFLEERERKQIDLWSKAEVIKISKPFHFLVELKDGQTVEAEKVIIACGGHAKSKHYEFIKEVGHTLIPPIPSLFTFNLKNHESNQLMGIAHEASVKLVGTDLEEYGPVLFTHWGMSGPAILKLSAKGAKYLHEKNYQFDFEVCWFDQAEAFIQLQRTDQAASKVRQSKPQDMSKRFWEYLLDRAKITPTQNWADLDKSQLQRLAEVLLRDRYSANGKTTFKEEFVTCGGVDLKEIEMKSMESKLIDGLYFCGEVVNVDALTGGFNFQAAWTTAWLAAQDISNKMI